MKKLVLAISVSLLLASPVFAQSFPDVAPGHKNYDAIEFLDERGIINGYQDGTFRPDDLVNRAEAAKIIVEAFNISHNGNYDVLFPDVPSDRWFFPFVMGGWEAEIISGYDNGTFRPEDSVNLAETLKMGAIASGITLPSSENENIFFDVSSSDWYAPHALFAKNKNIVFSDEKGNLNAGQAMTRAAFAEVIYRMIVVSEADGEPFPLQMNWPTYSEDFFKIKYDDQSWVTEKMNDGIIFYHPDRDFLQFSPGRIYPNSAVVWVTLDQNLKELGKVNYFDVIKAAFPHAEYTEFNFKGHDAFEVLYPTDRIVDWYIYLDDGRVMVAYTQYGSGPLGYQFQKVIKAMLGTLEYSEGGSNYDSLLSDIFESVLMEGRGMNMINKLPDKTIIETDALGVGTGPVDYYYSEALNYTLKYERSDDVILDTREGKTSAF